MTTKTYEFEFFPTLDGLTEVVLPANTEWVLRVNASRNKRVSEIFEVGPEGLTLGELIGVIAKTYARLAKELPMIKWESEDEKGEVPFWGDHCFPESITVDSKKSTVSLYLGS